MPVSHYSLHHCVYYECLYLGEWISGPTCMYMAEYLLKNYEAKDQDVSEGKTLPFMVIHIFALVLFR